MQVFEVYDFKKSCHFLFWILIHCIGFFFWSLNARREMMSLYEALECSFISSWAWTLESHVRLIILLYAALRPPRYVKNSIVEYFAIPGVNVPICCSRDVWGIWIAYPSPNPTPLSIINISIISLADVRNFNMKSVAQKIPPWSANQFLWLYQKLVIYRLSLLTMKDK